MTPKLADPATDGDGKIHQRRARILPARVEGAADDISH
jgi:hypothetical protein